MRFCFIFSIYLCSSLVCFGQKRPVDYSTPNSWPLLTKEIVSGDGKYLAYIRSAPVTGSVLVFRSTGREWEREFLSGGSAAFTADSRFLIFKQGKDSLGILDIAGDTVIYREHVISFTISSYAAGWLVYRPASGDKGIVLLRLDSVQETRLAQVSDFEFEPRRAALAVQTEEGLDSLTSASLALLDLNTGLHTTIWTGSHACKFVFSPSGRELALKTDTTDAMGNTEVVIEYYKTGMNKATRLVDPSTPGMDGRVLTDGTINDFSFSHDGSNLFFYTRPVATKEVDMMPGHLHIWNTQDVVLDDQLYSAASPRSKRVAVLNVLSPGRVILLERDIADFVNLKSSNYNSDRVLMYSNFVGALAEHKWRPSARADMFLVSTLNGSRRLIAENLNDGFVGFSPMGKYVVYFNKALRNWFAYNPVDNRTINISEKVKWPLNIDDDDPDSHSAPEEGMIGWLENDAAILVYDRYDIWRLDPQGRQLPVNLTGGYGRKNNIRLRAVNFNGKFDAPLQEKDTLLLTALDLRTKDNGFCKLVVGTLGTLIKLPMYPRIVYYLGGYGTDFSNGSGPFSPQKSENSSTYICRIMTVSEYPNIYMTHDFDHFTPLTKLEPQKMVKWFTNELVRWRLPNGSNCEGILYKPEDFNIHKKYPILFYVYEKFSDALHTFLNPMLSNGLLNIPWYLSHDYLVFIPDMHLQVGHPGESVCSTVESAAKYLSQYPWVNRDAMGIQGQSLGAWEVNYISTRTKVFAALASVDGVSDLVSNAGHIRSETGAHFYYEEGQGRMGSSLWENPAIYIENSPVFHADKLSAPILIAHNKGDVVVPFSQGVEWFTALRRLGKVAWFLQYEEISHTLSVPADRLDYSIRLSQFFDHFLKGAPAPGWMSSKLVSAQ